MTVTVLVTVADEGLTFTDRQVEVVRLIAAGFIDKEIGPKLGITTGGALGHVKVIREKLGGVLRRQIPLAFMETTGVDPYPRLASSTSSVKQPRLFVRGYRREERNERSMG